MSYIVNKTDGNIAAVVDDGTINTTTSLNLVGRGYTTYAETIAENLVALTENFANYLTPRNPLIGQLWYKLDDRQLKIFDGDKFLPVNNVGISSSKPQNPKNGDFWFDTVNQQLFFCKNLSWELISPAYSASQGKTGFFSESLRDPAGYLHSAVVAYATGKRIAMFSTDDDYETFPNIIGFSTVRRGLNMADEYLMANVVINGDAVHAFSSAGLDEDADATYMHANADTSTVGTLSVVNDGGLTIGNNGDITISTMVASPYTFGSSITINNDLSFGIVGYGGGTIVLDNATNWVAVNKDTPTVDLDVGGAINADEYIVSQNGYYFSDDSEITSAFNSISIRPGGVDAIIAGSDGNVSIEGFTLLNNDLEANGNILVNNGQISINQIDNSNQSQPGWPIEDNHAVTKQYTDELTRQNLLPIGSVIMWYGDALSVPMGWQICDGTNNTPDLRNQFVMGAGAQASLGQTGGSNAISNQQTNTAGTHQHVGTSDPGGGHNHGGNTGGHALTQTEIQNHVHTFSDLFGQQDDAGQGALDRNGNRFQPYNQWGNDNDGDTGNPVFFLNQTDAAGDSAPHVHPIVDQEDHTHTITIGSNGAHYHTVSFDNRPNWTALYYIMRVGDSFQYANPPTY